MSGRAGGYQNGFRRDFFMGPREALRLMRDGEISRDAFCVLSYVSSLDDGAFFSLDEVRRWCGGMNRYTWLRVARELREVGCYRRAVWLSPDGLMRGSVVVIGPGVGRADPVEKSNESSDSAVSGLSGNRHQKVSETSPSK